MNLILLLDFGGYQVVVPMFAKYLPFLLCPIAFCAEVGSLQPLVVSGDKLNRQAEQVSGSVTVLGSERLAALPPGGAGTYQDLLALTAGAYAGNPGAGTFSLRGLNQDNVFGYLGTGSNALINALLGSYWYWGQSFRIDFLICQLEDINLNPKGLTRMARD